MVGCVYRRLPAGSPPPTLRFRSTKDDIGPSCEYIQPAAAATVLSTTRPSTAIPCQLCGSAVVGRVPTLRRAIRVGGRGGSRQSSR